MTVRSAAPVTRCVDAADPPPAESDPRSEEVSSPAANGATATVAAAESVATTNDPAVEQTSDS